MELGEPAAVTALEGGDSVRIYSSDGEDVGALEHVLYDEESDVFDGLVIDIAEGPGGHRFVDAPQVLESGTAGVQIDVPEAAVDALPEPSASPAAVDFEPDDDGELERKLKRAWDYLSGNY